MLAIGFLYLHSGVELSFYRLRLAALEVAYRHKAVLPLAFMALTFCTSLLAIGLLQRAGLLPSRATDVPFANKIFAPGTRPSFREEGWVYVLVNPSMPGICKVGYTGKDPYSRARELGTTGVAEDFQVVWARRMPLAEKVEHQAHRLLDRRRVNERREFFRGSPRRMISAVKKAEQQVHLVARTRLAR
jgi:hypothetical protein